MIEILINGRFLCRPITGVERYAIELVKGFDRLLESAEIDPTRYSIVILVPRGTVHSLELKNISIRSTGRTCGHLWEQCELPFCARGKLLLNPCGGAPFFKRSQIVTIHDASIIARPQGYSWLFRTWYRASFSAASGMAREILTDSSFSKEELHRLVNIPNEKLRVVYLGHEHIFSAEPDRSVLERHGIGSRPYVLAVSSSNPNKNFAGLLRAVEHIGVDSFDVVIAGGSNLKVFAGNDLKLPPMVRHVGYVTDSELRALYEDAACFVYPSFYEGFGLPPLEAMACGCPVIVSDRASLPEICGDAAVYCNPDRPDEIGAAINHLMTNTRLRSELRNKGLSRSQRFRWLTCARETWQWIQKHANTGE
jgi:glycosyltransferase involved in cell wall biosynthesis